MAIFNQKLPKDMPGCLSHRVIAKWRSNDISSYEAKDVKVSQKRKMVEIESCM